MPLDRYGILTGTLEAHRRDQPDSQGRWYHVHLDLRAAQATYRCAVDVDSKQSAVGVQWRVLRVPASGVLWARLPSGYYELQRREGEGALDYLRHPALSGLPRPLRCFRSSPWLWDLAGRLFARRHPWTTGSHLEASLALESILVVGRRTFVWGEPFAVGLGMHNVHQNQGDPPGSQWWPENGIWQDGGTMVERTDGSFDVFISKFSTQASRTDLAGHPV